MVKFNTCRFCDIAFGKYHYQDIDEPFASNENFIAIASIGAAVEGWTLIIPKSHQLSMRNIYNNSNLCDFINSILPNLRSEYGALIAFEHGANKEGSITACGTDHAHLHLVPFAISLIPDIEQSGMPWVKCHSSEIAIISGDYEYLFYSELNHTEKWNDPFGYLCVLKYPISQYFRTLIAMRLGKIEMADYKRFPNLEIASNTRKTLAKIAA